MSITEANLRNTRPRSRSLRTEMAVEVPEGTHGDVAVARFEVKDSDLASLRAAMDGRYCRPGTYTELTRNGSLWMSDTDAERGDHMSPASAIVRSGGRFLVGGLGLGMVLRPAIFTPEVSHIDVVEIDPDVIALVGPHYQEMADRHGVTLWIHHDDVFSIKWPTNTRCDVAWWDVWPNLCEDNLDQMAELRRSYGRRADWNDCWGREILLAERRRTAGAYWHR